MITIRLRWQYLLIVLVISGFMALGSNKAATVDPAAETITLPQNIKWSGTPESPVQSAVLVGDPSKPGLYIELTKWHAPNHMSHPHMHPNDRFITVLSGTWWKGTGTKYDPDNTVPIPAGSFVIDHGRQYHFDGAKDQDTVLEVVGMGPANFPEEAK